MGENELQEEAPHFPTHQNDPEAIRILEELDREKAFFDTLARIEDCESEGNPLAKNPISSAKGLYQILDGTWADFSCIGDPYNAADNRACAIKIARTSGFHHWVCY